jgi:peptidoglycan/xylan/chitin deacetylase (PgdA/CDA1 family)
MNVFLSFDDGIQPGTQEVLDVLRTTGVRATFFLTGINLDHFFNSNRSDFLRIFNDIYQNHVIGNHSYTHGFDEYELFYTEGVFLDDTNLRMSVLDDFRKNNEIIQSYVQLIGADEKTQRRFPLSANQVIPIARFPATNIWMAKTDINNSGSEKIVCKISPEKQLITEQIYNDGYQIFGWDVEWHMNFDFYEDSLKVKQAWTKRPTFETLKNQYNDFDMYSIDNQHKDRLTEDWEYVVNQIQDFHNDKVVLLMHERAFRTGFNPDLSPSQEINLGHTLNVESKKLYNLITELKKQNCNFCTLDSYIS